LQALAILATWSLWQARGDSGRFALPNLPLFPLVQFDIAWLLLGSLVLILVRPTFGIACHTFLLAFAFAQDQLRLQPGFISLTILLWATLPYQGTRLIGRTHLFSLWLFAGLHKLLSTGYLTVSGPALWKRIFPWLDDSSAMVLAIVIALAETSIALFLLSRRTRKIAAWTACFIHLSIFVYLSPLLENWNIAVWPWNLALAAAGFAFIGSWKESLLETLSKTSRSVKAMAAILVIMPIGFYFGITDPYLAHCLYSKNTPNAWILRADNKHVDDKPDLERLSLFSLRTLHVPFPAQHRLYEQYFRLVGKPNDRLIIKDHRLWAESQGLANRTLTLYGELRDGKKEGPWVLQHDNGRIMAKGVFQLGKEEGLWTFWNAAGKKEGEGQFHQGKEEGWWTYWYSDGSHTELLYQQGKVVKER